MEHKDALNIFSYTTIDNISTGGDYCFMHIRNLKRV